MNSTSRRSFLSSAAKVAALATLPAMAVGGSPQYLLTLTCGFEGKLLAAFEFAGHTIPVDPRVFLSDRVHDVVAVVTDSISGHEKFRHYCDYKDSLGNWVTPAVTDTTHFAWQDVKRTPVMDGLVEWSLPHLREKYLCGDGLASYMVQALPKTP